MKFRRKSIGNPALHGGPNKRDQIDPPPKARTEPRCDGIKSHLPPPLPVVRPPKLFSGTLRSLLPSLFDPVAPARGYDAVHHWPPPPRPAATPGMSSGARARARNGQAAQSRTARRTAQRAAQTHAGGPCPFSGTGRQASGLKSQGQARAGAVSRSRRRISTPRRGEIVSQT